jgi:hypothetical protein
MLADDAPATAQPKALPGQPGWKNPFGEDRGTTAPPPAELYPERMGVEEFLTSHRPRRGGEAPEIRRAPEMLADAFADQNPHQRIGNVLEALNPFGERQNRGGYAANVGAELSGQARSTAQDFANAATSYAEHLKRGGNASEAVWTAIHAASGGTTPRDAAMAALTPEQSAKHSLVDSQFPFIHPDRYAKSISGQLDGVPAIGWNPQREGMNPLSYALNTLGEAIGRYATTSATLGVAFAPAMTAQVTADFVEATTGMPIQELIARFAHADYEPSGVAPKFGTADDQRRAAARKMDWDNNAAMREDVVRLLKSNRIARVR